MQKKCSSHCFVLPYLKDIWILQSSFVCSITSSILFPHQGGKKDVQSETQAMMEFKVMLAYKSWSKRPVEPGIIARIFLWYKVVQGQVSVIIMGKYGNAKSILYQAISLSHYHASLEAGWSKMKIWEYGTSPVSFEVLKCRGESCNLLGLQMDLPGQSGLLLLATLPRRLENKKCFRLRFKAQQGSRIKARPEPPGSAGGIISCGNVEGCQAIGRMGCALNHHMCTILYT